MIVILVVMVSESEMNHFVFVVVVHVRQGKLLLLNLLLFDWLFCFGLE